MTPPPRADGSGPGWSATQYALFEEERTRPVRDLLAAVPARPERVLRAVDLGCGPGNSTAVLIDRYPAAVVNGVDSSPDMLDAACRRLPGIGFLRGDIAAWRAETQCDVILSNAALQWVPDHATLLPRLAGMLAPGGSLAVQMPDNHDEPSHALMRAVAAEAPWAAALEGVAAARGPIARADWYYRLLRPVCARVDIWRTTYVHALGGGADAVVEWVRGTGLRPFLAPLDDAARAGFLARYRALVAAAYPRQPDGAVLLPFPRLFIVATR
ncbi:trans-aconitate 2-methyltransferase [Acidisphaera rubrifaciens]|uniref:Trans-aconitate 2-methyltransferase n=1 Tax=Acidisphaera rubrifaciens HS-AP3 TaxID=1231350 RepID=A0A0D6PAG5_9PROT|nr:trans-aconitate 2-methyltransferase [Acidisphaera rubrifaciens]GAN77864.1 trans-aconitate methyltransferase [Acidisphaera rubrifaciens HS-AP3]